MEKWGKREYRIQKTGCRKHRGEAKKEITEKVKIRTSSSSAKAMADREVRNQNKEHTRLRPFG
jgi:hypothetical protein